MKKITEFCPSVKSPKDAYTAFKNHFMFDFNMFKILCKIYFESIDESDTDHIKYFNFCKYVFMNICELEKRQKVILLIDRSNYTFLLPPIISLISILSFVNDSNIISDIYDEERGKSYVDIINFYTNQYKRKISSFLDLNERCKDQFLTNILNKIHIRINGLNKKDSDKFEKEIINVRVRNQYKTYIDTEKDPIPNHSNLELWNDSNSSVKKTKKKVKTKQIDNTLLENNDTNETTVFFPIDNINRDDKTEMKNTLSINDIEQNDKRETNNTPTIDNIDQNNKIVMDTIQLSSMNIIDSAVKEDTEEIDTDTDININTIKKSCRIGFKIVEIKKKSGQEQTFTKPVIEQMSTIKRDAIMMKKKSEKINSKSNYDKKHDSNHNTNNEPLQRKSINGAKRRCVIKKESKKSMDENINLKKDIQHKMIEKEIVQNVVLSERIEIVIPTIRNDIESQGEFFDNKIQNADNNSSMKDSISFCIDDKINEIATPTIQNDVEIEIEIEYQKEFFDNKIQNADNNSSTKDSDDINDINDIDDEINEITGKPLAKIPLIQSIDDIESFYDRLYNPNNNVMVRCEYKNKNNYEKEYWTNENGIKAFVRESCVGRIKQINNDLTYNYRDYHITKYIGSYYGEPYVTDERHTKISKPLFYQNYR